MKENNLIKEYRKKIGYRIRFFRELIGMKQLELGKLIGYKSRGAISLVETGERGMNNIKIKKTATVLGIHPYVLTADENFTGDELILLNQFIKILKTPTKSDDFNILKKNIQRESDKIK